MNQKSIYFLQQKHQKNQKITMLTAYDAPSASLCCLADVDCILVGDSLGMVIQGQNQTTHVTLDEMIYHVKNVIQGVKNIQENTQNNQNKQPFVIADMPFGTYATTETAFNNAVKLIQAGAQMVKLEGDLWLIPIIEFLTQRGILVCCHIGFTPQTTHALGGYKIQGRTKEQKTHLKNVARQLIQAGSNMLLLEMTTAVVSREIYKNSTIPIIGIGCGIDVSGQVLVWHDVLGITTSIGQHCPKFSKSYHSFIDEEFGILSALKQYVYDVSTEKFPQKHHAWEE